MPEVPEGVVTGGWSYVIPAYTITALVLIAYAWSLVSRLRKATKDEES